MERSEVFAELRGFIAHQLLDGEDIGLDGSTPLLEYGLINSTSVQLLLTFIARRFSLVVAPSAIRPDDFKNLDALTEMIVTLGR